MSPTTISDTLICITWPPRTTVNFCSCSMRLWRPRNCFSLLQSLKAVTRTTHTTDSRMAAPSIHPASASPSSSTPPAALPQSEHIQQHSLTKPTGYHKTCNTKPSRTCQGVIRTAPPPQHQKSDAAWLWWTDLSIVKRSYFNDTNIYTSCHRQKRERERETKTVLVTF